MKTLKIFMVQKAVFLLLLFATFSLAASGQNKDGYIYSPEAYDSPYIKITEAKVSGNKKTMDRIIVRELDFNLGDSLATFNLNKSSVLNKKRFASIDSSEVMLRLRYSRENIINTKLFLTVDLKLERISGNHYHILIEVTERWYFWVFPVVTVDAPNINEWLVDKNMDQLNMGLFTSHNNLWGRSHQVSLLGVFGSSQRYALGYHVPWIGNGQKVGLLMGAVYQENGVIDYGQENNERLMLYEQNSEIMFNVSTSLNIRPGLYNYGTIKLNTAYVSISDSLLSLSPNYLPDGRQETFTVNFFIDYAYDSRNNKSYPLKGNYLLGFVDKQGLGLLTHDVDYFFYGLEFHFYQKINKKFYAAEMVKAVNASSDNIAYSHKQNMTADGDFLRGFDRYSLKGDKMYYFRSNLKYELIEPTIRYPKKGPQDSKFKNLQYAFYLNFFSDVGYVRDDYTQNNPYNNELLFSWGLGLDLVSYYDMVLRFEYAITSIGSHGFFIGFGKPI